jgi:hydrogenase nickel incorporation protein HypB
LIQLNTFSTRLIEVRKNVLKQNDLVARSLRDRFRAANFVVSLVSSPGSGKTASLERTLTLLRSNYRVAALVGDLATENDALRLARSQAPVKQITTGTLCRFEAAMVESALEGWDLDELDFLFIENVGNLVCPSSYDLGEDMRVVLISGTRAKTNPSNIPRFSIARMSRSSASSIWRAPLNSAGRRHTTTSRPCVRACQSLGCRPRPGTEWASI